MIKLVASDLDGTLLRNGAQQLNPQVRSDPETERIGSSLCGCQRSAVSDYENHVWVGGR